MAARDVVLAHVETWRPYTAAYVGLAGLVGAAVAGTDEAWPLIVAWSVPTLAWIAGLYGGDYFDRELDAIEKPTRPIPSGRMRASTALALLWVCSATGAVVAALANPWTVLVAAAALALGLAYSMALKRLGILGNLARGAMMALVVVFGSMTAGDAPTLAVVAPALALWAHDVCSNLVGTVRDAGGDASGGYRTVAVARGRGVAAAVAGAAYVVAVVAAGVSLARPVTVPVAAPALLAAALLCGGAAAGLLLGSLDRLPALRAHSVLLVGRILLASALLTPGLGAQVGVVVAVLATVFTVVATRALRARHESMGTPAPPSATPVAADAVQQYVDDQLARIDALPTPPRTLTTWQRHIRVDLTEPACAIGLAVGGGRISRDPQALDDPDALVIATTGATFAAIFWTRTSNPRRAFLLRRLRFDGSTGDMVHANALFAEFLRFAPADRSPTLTTPRDRQAGRDAGPDAGPTAASMPPRVVVADTTLRDGEQAPGVAFDLATKVEVARMLDAAGVALIEVGFPAVSPAEADAVREVAGLGLGAQTQAIARPVEADVVAALDSGVDQIAVFVGTSDLHMRAKLASTPAVLQERVAAAVALAVSAGASVVFAAEDATRSDPAVLLDFLTVAHEAGATAVGLADTAGVAHPVGFAALVALVADAVPLPVGVHCHDDLGLAVANSLAGVAAGASGVQGSVLGIGERAGNAALEELVMALEIAHGVDSGIDTRALRPLAARVAAAAGLPVPVNKPVVGAHMFTHESGLHVDGIIRAPACYEPYPPELVGATRRIVLGKHSGRSCVTAVLAEQGVHAGDDEVREVLDLVKRAGEAGRSVDGPELVAMLRALAPVVPVPVPVPVPQAPGARR